MVDRVQYGSARGKRLVPGLARGVFLTGLLVGLCLLSLGCSSTPVPEDGLWFDHDPLLEEESELLEASSLKGVRELLVPEKLHPWRYIVLHHSATKSGSAALFDRWHREKGWDGLGYHFVIGCGNGSADGEIEVGFRWNEQREGAHAGNRIYNDYGIGICLVGNFNQTRPTSAQLASLRALLLYLMWQYRIPAKNVTTHKKVRDPERGPTDCPGSNFSLESILAGT